MNSDQKTVVGVVAGVTLLLELFGLLFAIHNVYRYLYQQRRYIGNGLSLLVFYVLAILIFSLRIAQIIITVDPKIDGESAKVAYIIGMNIVMLEFDVGVTMIVLIRQLQVMLKSVVVFQRPEEKFRLKLIFVALTVLALETPIIVSFFFYSREVVEDINIYLPCLFGLLVIGLTYWSLQVVIQIRKLPRIINLSNEIQEERRNLYIVLAVFDMAFMVRVILNCTLFPEAYSGQDSPYKFYLTIITPDFFLDVVPLVGVMWLHHQSFKRGRDLGQQSTSVSLVSLDSSDRMTV